MACRADPLFVFCASRFVTHSERGKKNPRHNIVKAVFFFFKLYFKNSLYTVGNTNANSTQLF